MARLDRGGNEFVTRIRDKGCSGVGNERDGAPLREALQDPRPDLRRIMVVIGQQRWGEAITVEKFTSDARILAQHEIGGGNCCERPQGDIADRKSTRLNSSHTVISYAVFCLQKKKKNARTLQDDSIWQMLLAGASADRG